MIAHCLTRPVSINWSHYTTFKIVLQARIKKFLGGPTFPTFFIFFHCFSWWGERGSKYHYKCAIIGPPAKLHLNGVSLAGLWRPNIERWLGSFVILQGIQPSIAKKPLILWFFVGVPDPLPPPSGSAQVLLTWCVCSLDRVRYNLWICLVVTFVPERKRSMTFTLGLIDMSHGKWHSITHSMHVQLSLVSGLELSLYLGLVEKSCLRCFRLSKTLTTLLSYRD